MAAKRITLTLAEVWSLRDLEKAARSVESRPLVKLLAAGFAVKVADNGQTRFEISAAGRNHLQVLDKADKKCSRCKTAPWTCRVCGRKTCEHFCKLKTTADRTALCGRTSCSKT